jgi:hypothetical protein
MSIAPPWHSPPLLVLSAGVFKPQAFANAGFGLEKRPLKPQRHQFSARNGEIFLDRGKAMSYFHVDLQPGAARKILARVQAAIT